MSSPNVPFHRQLPPGASPSYSRKRFDQHLNPWIIRLPLLAFAGIFLLFFVLTILVAGYQFAHEDEIYPGVSTVFGLNLAGMTRQEAVVALDEQFTYPQDATFTFRYGGQSWTYSAAELGVALDVAATVNAAYDAGRGGSRLDNLIDQLSIRSNGYEIQPVIVYNQTLAEEILTGLAHTYVNQPVIDATLTIRDGRAVSAPSQVGRTMDVAATMNVLRQEILALNAHSEITLAAHETPPVVWSADEAAEQVNVALSHPIEFYVQAEDGNDGPWVSEVASIEKMISLEKVSYEDGTVGYEVQLDPEDARQFLNRLAPDLVVEPADARFTFDDETHQLEVIQNSVNGRALDIEATVTYFQDAVFASNPIDRRVPLVFRDVYPTVSDQATATELGITELVIQKTTYFYGSTSARRQNIKVATENFHGLVIPPGGEFSFNEWLGDVSVESGYEQGLIIVGNQTITGVGGGVCQVATTAFQTAFYGGYPINERVEHAYRVAYYEEGEGPGMDATVYSPLVDFRFTNDTPYYLLIETYLNQANSTLTWKFYSTGMDRRVEKEGPVVRNVTPAPSAIYRANSALTPGQIKQVDYATSGADVYVYRTVYEGDRVIIDREEFHSHYVPWASQYEVAPGDSRING